MEDLKEQLEDFNELHDLGIELLTQLEDAVEYAQNERDVAQSDLKNIRDEVDEVKKTNKNLSAELAKCQKALEIVKRERDELRGKYEDNRLELGRYQEAFSRISRERDELRGKFDELKKILAR